MKIKLGILFGGKSVEHEVSIISALQAAASIDRTKYDVVYLYMTRQNTFFTGEAAGNIENYRHGLKLYVYLFPADGRVELIRYPMKKLGNNLVDTLDVIFSRLSTAPTLRTARSRATSKTLGVPFVGCDVLASALGMDKYMMKCVWKEAGPAGSALSQNRH